MDGKFIEISDLGVSPDYLMHHQIKGAKWGVFRGPPYPLGSGINTRVKKKTKEAEKRAEEQKAEKSKSSKKKPMTKRQAQKIQKQRKQEEAKAAKKERFPKGEEDISKMTNKQLQKAVERLKLENAYKSQLPKEQPGKNFLQKSAETFQQLKVLSDRTTELVNSGKALGTALGVYPVENKPKKFTGDPYSMDRLPKETPEAYAKRLRQLSEINKYLSSAKSDGSSSNTNSSSSNKPEEGKKDKKDKKK